MNFHLNIFADRRDPVSSTWFALFHNPLCRTESHLPLLFSEIEILVCTA